MFQEYISSRADLSDFLNPLFGCHLICPCKLHGMQCHVRQLQSLCCDIPDKIRILKNDVVDYLYNREVSSQEDYDDSNDEHHFHGRVTENDETLIGDSLPMNVPWPQAWKSLGDDIRAQQSKGLLRIV